ncbi:MAG: flagellar export chaperone FliS [Phycisphaerae bacterium]
MFQPPSHADNPVEMNGAQPNSYLRNAVMQASPEQLQLMLYDGAIRFALKGRQAILDNDPEETYNALSRSQKIVLEMDAGLKPEINKEVCEKMSALFNFVYRKLVNASVRRDASDIDDALKILHHQRETWVILMEKVSHLRAEEADGDLVQTNREGPISVQG